MVRSGYLRRAFNSGVGPLGLMKGAMVLCGFLLTNTMNVVKLDRVRLFRNVYFLCYFAAKVITDRSNLTMLKHFMSKKTLFLDIGAAYGLYTKYFCNENGPLKIWAFEPDPKCQMYLQDQVKFDSQSIELHKIALSDEVKNLRLYTCSENAGENSLFQGDVHDGFVDIPASTLDTIMKSRHLGDVLAIVAKLDVQGAEALVISGGRELFQKCDNVLLLFEFSPSDLAFSGVSPEDLFEELHAQGFTVYQDFDVAAGQLRGMVKCANDVAFPTNSGRLGQVDLMAVRGFEQHR